MSCALCWDKRPSGETVQVDQVRQSDVKFPETTKHEPLAPWDSI